MCDDDKYNDDPAVRSGLHLFSLFFFATEEGPFGAEMICQMKLSTMCLTLKIQQIPVCLLLTMCGLGERIGVLQLHSVLEWVYCAYISCVMAHLHYCIVSKFCEV